MGWFEPTEIGERLLPTLTLLGPYHEAISREMADGSLPSGEAIARGRRKDIARKALGHKLTRGAVAALEALRLELRDAEGNVIPTESIALQDTEYLVALGGDIDEPDDDWDEIEMNDDSSDADVPPDEFSSALIELGIEEDLTFPDDWDVDSRDWEPCDLPRYQIFVDLIDGKSIPVSDRWKDDPYVQALVAGRDPMEALKSLDEDRD